MRCHKCNATAVIFQKYSGLHLCKRHFFEDVERKIKRHVRRYYVEGTLAVALSGGKDSAVALYVLNEIYERSAVELVAITVDEGIAGYRDKTMESAAMLVTELGVRWEVTSFQEEFDVRIDQIKERPCTYCGIFRRSLLNRMAKKVGATTLATGHNLDDEAQTVLMNYLRGDIDRLLRLEQSVKEGLIPRMKPLRDVPEKEVALYAILKGLPIDLSECEFSLDAFRAEVRDLLNDFEYRHPGTKYSLVRGLNRISGLAKRAPFELRQCKKCGEPSVNEFCQTCEALTKLGKVTT
jgi:uncharacterized protein (TIGR00269 family)